MISIDTTFRKRKSPEYVFDEEHDGNYDHYCCAIEQLACRFETTVSTNQHDSISSSPFKRIRIVHEHSSSSSNHFQSIEQYETIGYTSILNQTSDAILVIEDGLPVYATTRCLELLDISNKVVSFNKQKPFEFIFEDDDSHSKFVSMIERSSNSEEVLEDLFITKTRFDSTVPIRIRFLPHNPSSRKVFCVMNIEESETQHSFIQSRLHGSSGLIQMADDAIKLEEIIQDRTHDLEQALDMKTQLIGIMSHEIRTPLFGILGMVSLLALSPDLPSDKLEMAQTAQVCCQQLTLLISDILDYMKADSNKIHIENIPIDLINIVEDSLEVILCTASTRNIELSLDYNSKVLDIDVLGDSTKIRQVILNILSNAVKFSPDGSQIEIDINVTDVVFNSSSYYEILFAITDHGIGIPKHLQHNIFQPFHQADASISRKFGGTGLGLAISKHIAKLMNGDIWFSSEDGMGSTFYFKALLQKHEVPRTITSSTSSTSSNTSIDSSNRSQRLSIVQHLRKKSLTVVIVDSSTRNAESYAKRFEWFGCRTIIKNSIDDLREIIDNRSTRKIDFCLLDIKIASTPEIKRIPLGSLGRILICGCIQQFQSPSPLSTNSPAPIGSPTSSPVPSPSTSPSTSIDRLSIQRSDSLFVKKPLRIDNLAKLMFQQFNRDRGLQKSMSAELIERSLTRIEKRILCAEDNLINQRVIKKMIESFGYKPNNITFVNNGKEAVDIVQKQQFDLILMDVMMPEMNGLDATCMIRKITETKQCTIIGLTASAMEEDIQKCLESGMDDVITKPINMKSLQDAIASCPTIKSSK